MKTNEIREAYLSFFESKGCVRRPSDVLVPRDDPTVLFTPAGMNQFKNEFLGIGKLDFTKATTCQKCLRTGDISNVGVTAYHHTFFEMLGNFSFGDYFKREAIHWAWEFLTDAKWLKLDPERLTVSVYKGTHGFDEEAYNIWKNEVGLPEKRIACLEEDENYWPASAPSEGPDGVCGPCSEIFFHPPGGGKDVEIWNLVFTQFNRVGNPPDNLKPLPSKNIDTGMGLERTAAVMQGVQSNFENDVLKPLCLAAAEVVGAHYDFAAKQGRPLRRIADHVRAATFAIHEGVIPDREKENYVIRQLVRRGLLEGYLLGKREPFLFELVPAVVDVMAEPYPELKQTVDSVQNTIREEESQFLDTIERGLRRFDKSVESAKAGGSKRISGDDLFHLHTEDGFLLELSEALAEDRGFSIDRDRYDELTRQHEDVSRGGRTSSVMSAGPLDLIRKEFGDTEFRGYSETSAEATVVGLITPQGRADRVERGFGGPVGVILNPTPFYGESGGQVGDSGTLSSPDMTFEVSDTQKHMQSLHVHEGRLRNGSLAVGDTVTATVNLDRRSGVRRAHSATHLLHHALHVTVGDQATQRGSKVDQDWLRFDFAHKRALTPDEIRRVEDIINERIASGAAISTEMMELDDAKMAGAMALFGEKYPDRVRVVQMGDFSTELCGGTHLTNTGQVGLCRVISEENVAKGVRRIVALTGPNALRQIREAEDTLLQLAGILKAPLDQLVRRAESLQEDLRATRKELADRLRESVSSGIDEIIAGAEDMGDVKLVKAQLHDVPREALRDYVDQIRGKLPAAAIILGAEIEGKVALITAVSKPLTKRGLHAGQCVKAAAQVAGGGGGGRPDMAEAGAKDPAKLEAALEVGMSWYREHLDA